MSFTNISGSDRDVAVAALGTIARQHCTQMEENFIYVLTWREWGGCWFTDRIEAEYDKEVPRTLRLIERILELGGSCPLPTEGLPYVEHLPRPGRTLPQMLEHELARNRDFNPTLLALGKRLSDCGEVAGSRLATEAAESRAAYVAWLSDPVNQGDTRAGKALACVTDGMQPTWYALSRLYAHLTAAIEETLIHAMSLRHARLLPAANQSWADSFAYMLYAGQIVSLFARHGWALDLEDESVSGDVKEPTIDNPPEAAIATNRRRQRELMEAARIASEGTASAGDPGFSATPTATQRYLASRMKGLPGKPPRPALPLDDMLREQRIQ